MHAIILKAFLNIQSISTYFNMYLYISITASDILPPEAMLEDNKALLAPLIAQLQHMPCSITADYTYVLMPVYGNTLFF